MWQHCAEGLQCAIYRPHYAAASSIETNSEEVGVPLYENGIRDWVCVANVVDKSLALAAPSKLCSNTNLHPVSRCQRHHRVPSMYGECCFCCRVLRLASCFHLPRQLFLLSAFLISVTQHVDPGSGVYVSSYLLKPGWHNVLLYTFFRVTILRIWWTELTSNIRRVMWGGQRVYLIVIRVLLFHFQVKVRHRNFDTFRTLQSSLRSRTHSFNSQDIAHGGENEK
jgi:hypothetical protein